MTPDELQRVVLDTIPLARAMDLEIVDWDGARLHVRAPLEPNRNDKGCAFGGSLVGLMTLAGWGCAVLRLGNDGGRAEVYVQDSDIRYLTPVWETIEVFARLDDDDGEQFGAAYRARGRARTSVRAVCRLGDGRDAATLSARFVAIDPTRRSGA